MPRPSNHRTDAPPVMTRFSPEELLVLDAKRVAAGTSRSGLIRAAVAAYDPAAPRANAIREPAQHGGNAIRDLTFVPDDQPVRDE